jgi:hypothetical protein
MSTLKPERLLIADDEPNLLTAYVLFFEAYGYEIRTASDNFIVVYGKERPGSKRCWLPRYDVRRKPDNHSCVTGICFKRWDIPLYRMPNAKELAQSRAL